MRPIFWCSVFIFASILDLKLPTYWYCLHIIRVEYLYSSESFISNMVIFSSFERGREGGVEPLSTVSTLVVNNQRSANSRIVIGTKPWALKSARSGRIWGWNTDVALTWGWSPSTFPTGRWKILHRWVFPRRRTLSASGSHVVSSSCGTCWRHFRTPESRQSRILFSNRCYSLSSGFAENRGEKNWKLISISPVDSWTNLERSERNTKCFTV